MISITFSELRHYKNDHYTQLNNSNFEIATLFHHIYGKGKSAVISKLELFLTEWSCSYIVFALKKTLLIIAKFCAYVWIFL